MRALQASDLTGREAGIFFVVASVNGRVTLPHCIFESHEAQYASN